MKIEIKKVQKDIVQITTLDERWYQIGQKFLPSVTWITGYYPKGVAFYKWLANHGWDEAEAIKQAAGDKGSRVHHGCNALMAGEELAMDAQFPNSSGEVGELSVEEWECLMSFTDWWQKTQPTHIAHDVAVYTNYYAGTLDLICEIDGKIWLIDFKTGQNIWPEYELQVSAYRRAYKDKIDAMGILQLGYRRNKNMYKMNEIEDKMPLFDAAYQIWQNENPDAKPKQKDYPLTLKL